MIPRASEIETRLRERYGDGAVYGVGYAFQELANYFQLTPQDLAEWDGSHPRFKHKVESALTHHRKLGLLVRPKRGCFRYLPEKLTKYEPRHHPPRDHNTSPSRRQPITATEVRRRLTRKWYAMTVAIRELEQHSSPERPAFTKALRHLKLKRHAIALAIRELAEGAS